MTLFAEAATPGIIEMICGYLHPRGLVHLRTCSLEMIALGPISDATFSQSNLAYSVKNVDGGLEESMGWHENGRLWFVRRWDSKGRATGWWKVWGCKNKSCRHDLFKRGKRLRSISFNE